MTTINLHQDEQTGQSKISSKFGKGGLFLSLGVFICTLLVLAGLKMAVSRLQQQNTDLETKIAAAKNSLIGLNNIKQFADIQARLKEIKNNLQIKNSKVSRVPMTEILDNVGNNIDSSGVFLTEYKNEEGNKISLKLNTTTFSEAAKQIFNLKNSKYFSNVSLDTIKRGEKYIECEVIMSVK